MKGVGRCEISLCVASWPAYCSDTTCDCALLLQLQRHRRPWDSDTVIDTRQKILIITTTFREWVPTGCNTNEQQRLYIQTSAPLKRKRNRFRGSEQRYATLRNATQCAGFPKNGIPIPESNSPGQTEKWMGSAAIGLKLICNAEACTHSRSTGEAAFSTASFSPAVGKQQQQ